mmetsp:Transcript_9832/g.14665  ORF Transcript_9832/g.14665 Transcript_9832/m.14665 type:complete len:1003 (+) Transcript_9832:12-3020(+)
MNSQQSLSEPLLGTQQKPKDTREIHLDGTTVPRKFTHNAVTNTKYNIVTFLPLVLWNQFKYFFNFFFLGITLSQLVPQLQVGYLFTYLAPLVFVLTITIIKEAYDDLLRMRRDKEVNSQTYSKITRKGTQDVQAAQIKVGNLIEIKANQRIPADMVLMHTTEESGTVFIRTDQLDGETDWKLRKAVNFTQQLSLAELRQVQARVTVEPPQQNIYGFEGTAEVEMGTGVMSEALTLEHTLWTSTVLASGTAVGLVVYTGKDTRSARNSKTPSQKLGVCDQELSFLSFLLFLLMVVWAFAITAMAGLTSNWYFLFLKFLLLLSSVIPISLRVNLDMGKLWYCNLISRDKSIKNTIARNSNIPEELGRIQYLMTDKTGTLTQNEMVFKKASLSFGCFSEGDSEAMEEFKKLLEEKVHLGKKETAVKNLVTALALCHNVTPVTDKVGQKSYQASSPDEVALVKFAEKVGVELVERRQDYMVLKLPSGEFDYYTIHNVFPFSSETKRMGILVQNRKTGKVSFFLKGAEDVMQTKVSQQEAVCLTEECENLGREGLRTLIVAYKELSLQELEVWKKKYDLASKSFGEREKEVSKVVESLEENLSSLGVTGVEDKLQHDVPQTIENMRNAGMSVWILTGDKVETAECIAISTRLKTKNQRFYEICNVRDPLELEAKFKEYPELSVKSLVLVIDGTTLQVALSQFEKEFIEVASLAPAVVCCRVAPTQKTQIVEALKKYKKERVCSVGDGGNDVGMIQAAHIGIGIEGKEGKQASLAADFSISEFKSLNRLILWHGRLSYKRTAKLGQFVFHRGLIISVIQFCFSCMFYFSPIPLYNGFLMLGYTTIYTMMPVFSLVLDEDASIKAIMQFPNLYASIQNGKALSWYLFLVWVWKSFYQGGSIIVLSLYLFPDTNFVNIVAITFTALIFTELLNVVTEIDNFHWGMGVSEVVTIIIYTTSMFVQKNYFDLEFVFSWDFVWRVAVITSVSWLPIHLIRVTMDKLDPEDRQKV